MRLGEIAKLIEGKLIGEANICINRIVGIEEAKEGDITWVSHPRYEKWFLRTKASCVIVPKQEGDAPLVTNIIEVANPSLAVVKLLKEFYPEFLPAEGINPQAHIDRNVEIGKGVSIGAFSYVAEGAIIGDKVIIFPYAYIGREVKIGAGTRIYPNVAILDNVTIGSNVRVYSGAVIGSDGFAYTQEQGKQTRIPHCGGVIIEDDVEIGALSTVCRAVIGNTIIKKGTKIDSLVHIAHNVVIGENSIIVAQVGIAGSVLVGKNAVIAGQAGITDHVVIGDNVKIGGQSGVTKDVPAGMEVCGYPASERQKSNLAYRLLMRLPELFKRVSMIEKHLNI